MTTENQLHTPGPWIVAETTWEDGIPETVISGLNGSAGIAVAIEFAQIPEMRDANARLISAAPELLSVAQGFRRKLATYVSVYPGDKELRRLLGYCDAAIAKATGATHE